MSREVSRETSHDIETVNLSEKWSNCALILQRLNAVNQLHAKVE